jgi:hypothetical protein
MKETFYFSHDYNTRSDNKIKRMLAKHGMAGYGIFWAIIEDLYNNANALRTDYDCIAYDLRSDSDTIASIINDFELFENDGEYFGSTSVERRLDQRSIKSEKARESAASRWANHQKKTNAMRTHSDSNAIKESKVKESINIPFADFWELYDKKVGEKTKIEKKWNKLSNADREAVIQYIPKYKSAQPDKNYRKNPETFLNNHSWNDEIIVRDQNIKVSVARPDFQPTFEPI